MTGLIRNADLVVLVCDLSATSMIEDIRFVLSKLEEKRIVLSSDVSDQSDDPRMCEKKTIICAHKEYDDEDGAKRRLLSELFEDYTIVTQPK